MKYITTITGKIDITGVPKLNKLQIRNYLEEIYPVSEIGSIFSDDELNFDEEWDSFDRSEKFLIIMWKISKQVLKETRGLIMCSGEREGDIWGIIIKDNRLFTQRYELKAEGDAQEYEKVRF
ncbi:MAG: hypothetical protein AABZ74_10110 [Cyanobacteriota bacterium]